MADKLLIYSKNSSLSNHTAALSKTIDLFTTKYECLLFLVDFNAGMGAH